MAKIRWSSDQLQAFDEGFHERVGFHPPAPKVPSGKTVPNYFASLSDKEFMTLGRVVHNETKGLVNGWPSDDLIQVAIHSFRARHKTGPVEPEPYNPEIHFPQYKDMLKVTDVLNNIEKVGRIVLDGPRLEGDQKRNQQILRKSLFSEYKTITEIGTDYSGEMLNDWVDLVDQIALHVLNYSGHATQVYRIYLLLQDELKRRRPPQTAKQVAEESEKKKAADDAFLDEWAEYENPDEPDMSDDEYHVMHLEEALSEEQQKSFAYETILKEISRILESKDTVEEKLAALEKTIETHDLYTQRGKTEVDKNLAGRKTKPEYERAVYKLNGIPNIKGKTFTALFKPFDLDGKHRNGHSKQMLALRTGVIVEYKSSDRLKFTVIRRRKDIGNDVDCEIHHGDKRIQTILSLECDERDDFVVGTVKAYENRYWEDAEKNLLRSNYKEMQKPVSWFADYHPKIQEEVDRLIGLDKQKLEKRARDKP